VFVPLNLSCNAGRESVRTRGSQDQ
jgi:hypothetical protein